MYVNVVIFVLANVDFFFLIKTSHQPRTCMSTIIYQDPYNNNNNNNKSSLKGSEQSRQ